MAFVHHDVAVLLDQVADFALAGEGLHDGNVNLARWFALASTDGAEITLLQVQEGAQPLLPLLEQFGAMKQGSTC